MRESLFWSCDELSKRSYWSTVKHFFHQSWLSSLFVSSQPISTIQWKPCILRVSIIKTWRSSFSTCLISIILWIWRDFAWKLPKHNRALKLWKNIAKTLRTFTYSALQMKTSISCIEKPWERSSRISILHSDSRSLENRQTHWLGSRQKWTFKWTRATFWWDPRCYENLKDPIRNKNLLKRICSKRFSLKSFPGPLVDENDDNFPSVYRLCLRFFDIHVLSYHNSTKTPSTSN
jgi:hypothetical protein